MPHIQKNKYVKCEAPCHHEGEGNTVDLAKLSICGTSGEDTNYIFMYRRKRQIILLLGSAEKSFQHENSAAQLFCLHQAATMGIQLTAAALVAALLSSETTGYWDRYCLKLERFLNSTKKSSTAEAFEARTKDFLLLPT